MRKEELANDAYYHVYNRGTDKRNIFDDQLDMERFISSVKSFNTLEPIGSIYELSFEKPEVIAKAKPLTTIVAYAFNPNHFHFLIRQNVDQGIEKFMHRLGTGYTKYYNHRNKRSGVLFQGRYKTRLVEDNEHLLDLSVYVNLNAQIHQSLGSSTSKWKLEQNSLREYDPKLKIFEKISDPSIVLERFKNFREYKEFCDEAFKNIVERKILLKELGDDDLEVELPS